ncbi:hypothetical protein LCGC14_2230450 [marine sediment metagenome]|uniref:Uncharacterized protein n=1 Tax=marine sediment metagenome TaxID=412755 RepID=A0A0F9G3M7_9ZZZZ
MTAQQLANLGVYDAKTIKIYPRLILSLCGLEKQGKTHFGLTAPGDIMYFNLDNRMEGVIDKFSQEKTISVVDISFSDNQDKAIEEWDKYMTVYNLALADPKIRTIIVDTATELWELLRFARFGRSSNVSFLYAPLNAEFAKMIRQPSKNTNVIFLHKMKPVYLNDKRTGDYERAGFGNMGFTVQVNAQIWRDEEGDRDFHCYIKDSGQNSDAAGEDLVGPLCNFPMLATTILPDTDPSYWE